ncbi:MAG: c-type cytochrome [Vicinamibacteraceae bacterium]|nr:c-type cytochrome [Vicinamibacteraceae bacterium]
MRAILAVTLFSLALGPAVAMAQDAAKVEAGKKLYTAQKCQMCHSIAGVGNKKYPLDGVGKKLSEADLKLWIVDPKAAEKKFNSTAKPPMKAYANLPAADVDALVAYMKSLK